MPDVTTGQRFRDAQPTMFGDPPPDWIVDDVVIGTDGKEYAPRSFGVEPAEPENAFDGRASG